MKVSIVIPNWNGEEKLRKNLPKVLKVKGVEEIIISDDASTDNSVKVIESEFPQIKLVKKTKNGGFAVNVNNGVKQVKTELFLLLNSDAVPDEDCLKDILPHFEKNPRVFGVSLNAKGNWSWARFKDGYFWHYMSDQKVETHQTLWASGGSSVFKKSVWDSLNGLDEMYSPFYEEDVDLGYRATKRGFINIFEPKAKVEHYQEKGVIELNFSKSKISKTAQRNQLLFIWKNITDKEYTKQHIWALIKKLLVHPKYWLVFLAAVSFLSEVQEKRRKEIVAEVIPDKEIFTTY